MVSKLRRDERREMGLSFQLAQRERCLPKEGDSQETTFKL